MAGNLERALAILELLAVNAGGLPLHVIADRLDIPRSATHRLLSSLMQRGYVRQEREHGQYVLALKLVSLGLAYLATTGVVDIAQPILDRLAAASGELVRLSVIEEGHLIWVAKAQGARAGLRYDPDTGREVTLFCTANGHAWLSCLSDEEALKLVSKQGFGSPGSFGPGAPRTIQALLKQVRQARSRGYATVSESYEAGTAAMAAPVRHAVTGAPIGCVSIAGPVIRMTPARMQELGPALLQAAAELSAASLGSPSFKLTPSTSSRETAKA